jgi:hypothetical protein
MSLGGLPDWRGAIGRLVFVLLALGCGGTETPHGADGPADAGAGPDGLAVDSAADGAPGVPAGGDAKCSVELAMPADEGANHVAECAAVSYGSKPPSSGNHYPRWAVFRVYTKPVPWGFLMHAMEHGAVVIVYNCPDGCAGEVAAARTLVENTPPKMACSRPPVILAPDPTLDVRFAAAAWQYTLRASCFDQDAFATFITAHADRGPEMIAGDCGLVDLEARDWCAGVTP